MTHCASAIGLMYLAEQSEKGSQERISFGYVLVEDERQRQRKVEHSESLCAEGEGQNLNRVRHDERREGNLYLQSAAVKVTIGISRISSGIERLATNFAQYLKSPATYRRRRRGLHS